MSKIIPGGGWSVKVWLSLLIPCSENVIDDEVTRTTIITKVKKLDILVNQTAMTFQNLTHSVSRDAEPVEDESPLREEEEDKTQTISKEGESTDIVLSEDGSGSYEGPAADIADRAFVPLESDTGSGESWTEEYMEWDKGKFLGKMS